MQSLPRLFLTLTSVLAATSALAQAPEAGGGRWMINLDGTGIFFPNLSAKISLAGANVTGASINVPSEATITIDAGYFVTHDIAVDVYGGFPPKAQILGTGPLAPLGTLATTWYGPAVVALQYYIPGLGCLHPYAGLGLNYTFFMGTADRALNHVQPADTFGAAFEAGLHYDMMPRFTFNIDMKYIAMSTRISAEFQTPTGSLPAVATAGINPLILGIGVGYHF